MDVSKDQTTFKKLDIVNRWEISKARNTSSPPRRLQNLASPRPREGGEMPP
jgi:hypothetical protein